MTGDRSVAGTLMDGRPKRRRQIERTGDRSVAGKVKMMQTERSTVTIFRVTVEVDDLDRAAAFYGDLLGIEGTRHPGARAYFNCGGVILAVIDVSAGGLQPQPGPKSLYFAVDDLEAVHARAKRLEALAPYTVHGEPAGEIVVRPWQERSFYVVDPWGNELCFVEQGTLYT